MTRQRAALYALLAVVAAAAAVLSFSALRDLAAVCGFGRELAWLLPVTIDAGAAAASIVWLGATGPPAVARYARVLALTLLGSSVAGNALGHGLAAFTIAPPWWVVVGVSAIAPAVLGAVGHLVVLVGRPPPPGDEAAREDEREGAGETREELTARLLGEGASRQQLARRLGVTEWAARGLQEAHRRERERGEVSA